MAEIIARSKTNNLLGEKLIKEVRDIWNEWDLQEDEFCRNDDQLKFDSFYNGFMAPYFGCFSCEDTRKGLKAIDMDSDGQVDWNEFLVKILFS